MLRNRMVTLITLLVISLIFTSNIFAVNYSTDLDDSILENKSLGFIGIGYNLKEENTIFGNKPKDLILMEVTNLLDSIATGINNDGFDEEILFLKIKTLYGKNKILGEGLNVYINDGVKTITIGSDTEEDFSIDSYDDTPISETFQFAFNFEDPGGGYFPTAYYSTKVNGILSPNNTAFIEKLSTTHQGGSYFPFTDYYDGTKYAKTIIRNLYTLPFGTINLVGIHYEISNSGRIDYIITNPSN